MWIVRGILIMLLSGTLLYCFVAGAPQKGAGLWVYLTASVLVSFSIPVIGLQGLLYIRKLQAQVRSKADQQASEPRKELPDEEKGI
ncbi:MAG: hypothetical protein HUJ72_00595 [Blautia sp.]|nr:hypothetical protein [Blautia sp.]